MSFFTLVSCSTGEQTPQMKAENYKGTAAVSQGSASVVTQNLFNCERGRKAPIGILTAIDGSK